MHAADVLNALRHQGVSIDAFGMGASHLAESGTELLVDCRDLAVIGLVDVLFNYHRFLSRLKILREGMQQRRPDILLLVDYPDFNLKLAETARELGIPVLYYISPKIWAWRPGRIQRIAQLVDHMAVIFPFEVEIYQQADIPVTYVGNPLVEQVAAGRLSREQARQAVGTSSDSTLIALLPGSRSSEIRRNLPRMLDAARQLAPRYPDCHFLLPVASTLSAGELEPVIDAAGGFDTLPPIDLLAGNSLQSMQAADVALVASGTATLETALCGTPMVVMYVMSPVNYTILRRLVRIPRVSLVNIVAGRAIVPEYLQDEASGSQLAQALEELLDDPSRRQTMQQDLLKLRQQLGHERASENVARLILELTTSPRQEHDTSPQTPRLRSARVTP